jgi:hypothetical protein
MSRTAAVVCAVWIAAAFVAAALGALRSKRDGTLGLAARRLRSPTVYLFSAYLLVAAFVTPRSAGETTSPLLWLAFALPAAYALASLSAAGRSATTGSGVGPPIALALLHGGAVLAIAAVILSLVSPAFVPAWLR